MAKDMIPKAPIDRYRRAALEKFKIGGRGLKVVMQKGKAGNQFRFRPVAYDHDKDLVILHHGNIIKAVKNLHVPAEALLRYVMFFGIGMAAEFRRMSTSGVCPMFNFVHPDTRRKWYKVHWTQLEEEANFLGDQLVEFTVDSYLFKSKMGNPVPVTDLNRHLKKLRKDDPSKWTKELQQNMLHYIARARFCVDTVAGAEKERDVLENNARSAAGPERWFHLNRAVKMLKFGNPENYRDGYPAVARALYPEIDIISHDTTLTGLPERERFPKVWKSDNCTYFEWSLQEEEKAKKDKKR